MRTTEEAITGIAVGALYASDLSDVLAARMCRDSSQRITTEYHAVSQQQFTQASALKLFDLLFALQADSWETPHGSLLSKIPGDSTSAGFQVHRRQLETIFTRIEMQPSVSSQDKCTGRCTKMCVGTKNHANK